MKPQLQSTALLATTLFLSGCGGSGDPVGASGSSADGSILQTLQERYVIQGDSTSTMVSLDYRIVNSTGDTLYLASPGIGFFLEKWRDGKWTTSLAPGPILAMHWPERILAPGESVVLTTVFLKDLEPRDGEQTEGGSGGIGEGTYRLRMINGYSSFDRFMDPPGELVPVELRLSNAFELRHN